MLRRVTPSELDPVIQRSADQGLRGIVEAFGSNFLLGDMLMVGDAALATKLLMNRPDTTHRAKSYVAANDGMPGGAGILFMDGEPWERRLRALMPAFKRTSIDSGTAVLANAVEEATSTLDASAEGDLFADVTTVGLRAVLRGGYGLNPDHPEVRAFGALMREYKTFTMSPKSSHRLDRIASTPKTWLYLPVVVKRLASLKGIVGRLERVVATLVADDSVVADRDGWFGRLVADGLRGRELTNELNHLYGAFTAADYTVTQTLIRLVETPGAAARALDEMNAASEGRASLALADLDRMPFTRGFVLEVMRLYPVSTGSSRQLGEPLTVEGETLPPGTQVMILLASLLRDPNLWPEPHALRPERWLEKNPDARDSGWIPFLRGPRKCIGRDLAELHLLLVVHAFLRRFDVTLAGPVPPVPPYLIPRFAGPVPWRRQRRASLAA